MLISAASQSTPRARSLQVRMSGSRSLRPAAATLLESRHRQQTRAYRFGMWSSYLDPELHRDLRRRQRVVRYKYVESLNRRLSWDQQPLADDPKSILRRVVGRYWTPRCASRSVNTGVYGRYGKPARADHAEAEKSFASPEPVCSHWKNELDGMDSGRVAEQPSQDRRVKRTSDFESDAQADIHAYAATVEEEYVIDPITNRKVLKKTYGSVPNNDDGSIETFGSHRTQFITDPASEDVSASQDGPPPVYSNGPPPRDELDKYSDVEIDPVAAGKPGQFSSTATLSEEYSLNHLPPEETEEAYDDLHKYNPSKYDEIQTKTEEESTPKYDDLHHYKPYKHNESATAENTAVRGYNDLHKYTPYMHNESSPAEQETAQYKDLGKYETHQGTTDPEAEEELGPQYEDLDKYKPTHFSDYKSVENPTPAYRDLDQYQPYQHEEDKEARPGLEAEPDYEDLTSYQPTEFENPVASQTGNSPQRYDDLSKYNPTKFHSPVVEDAEKPFHQYGDLDQYKAFRFQEPEGTAALEHDAVAESLKEFDSKNMSSNLTGNYARDFPEEFTASWSSTASGLQPDTQARDAQSAYNRELDGKVQSTEKDHSDNLSRTANASSVLETALDRQASAGGRERLMSHRERREVNADPYSRKPMGLETSYTDECGPDSSKPSYVKMYGRLDRTEEVDGTQTISAIPLEKLIGDKPATAREARPSAEPTIYKILAYDPTMQSISAADTTSVVPDQATPLTPAEALIRLSNPTKFLPHFAPLQAQGFEIVSGSGDVLIFRKVRDAVAAGPSGRPPLVNPIDMMGKPPPIPNAAAFASPTGFVNYDLPSVEEQSPPFRSNISVRREEPVFSGPKGDYTAEGNSKQKKTGFTKRVLVGGFWVAGISYALGVIAEYFTTGGVDGKGPTGF